MECTVWLQLSGIILSCLCFFLFMSLSFLLLMPLSFVFCLASPLSPQIDPFKLGSKKRFETIYIMLQIIEFLYSKSWSFVFRIVNVISVKYAETAGNEGKLLTRCVWWIYIAQSHFHYSSSIILICIYASSSYYS